MLAWLRDLRSLAVLVRSLVVLMGAALGLLAVALLAMAPTPAWARSSSARLRHPSGRLSPAELAKRGALPQERRSVVVAPGVLAAMDGVHLTGPADRIRLSDPEWLAHHAGRVVGRGEPIRCDLCVSSAGRARQSEGRTGEAVFSAANQVKSLGNQLTTLQISDATVKLTSLSPLGLQVRKPF
jgi:hypothetical protein